ncbi:Thymidylate kinase [Luteitalea pratensis]|uniref:Thymidylate kinase n=1 Tax=Luteitalea pratensis TaxID=1855912 RepID=A0A143PVA7_LUTPR|nr:dTMP kinase [Luteitalea pratensis]AMY12226.1 Thymidylate kinase [Luteitalea pratensis]
MTRGRLIAFEGLDQSGKQTQALRLRQALNANGLGAVSFDFPDYGTPIGREIGAALSGQRAFSPDCLQLLFVANRCEHRPAIETALAAGQWVVCDRYLASSIAYGEAQGLDPEWLGLIQRVLPPADLTVLLDIAPEVAAARKQQQRDAFEQDLALLGRVRASYIRQASAAPGWYVVDAARDRDDVTRDVIDLVGGL